MLLQKNPKADICITCTYIEDDASRKDDTEPGSWIHRCARTRRVRHGPAIDLNPDWLDS